MRRVIVSGGRDHQPNAAEVEAFARIWHDLTWGEDAELVHGACPTGVDAWADRWGKSNGFVVTPFRADWKRHGKPAGPIRNREAAAYTAPVGACVLFPGNSGTRDMRAAALAENLVVRLVAEEI